METMVIYSHMCDKQQEDIKQILTAADNLVECATNFAKQGGQSYTIMLQARYDFESQVNTICKNYRRVSTTGPNSILEATQFLS